MNWAKIEGYPYVIHPCGTILRIYHKHTRELKRRENAYGYMWVGLRNNNVKQKSFFVHRLLAIAFIPNPENKPCIDHINGVRDDNRLENLRWVTYKENMNGFRSNPAAVITKGCIWKVKNRNSWIWQYCMKGKKKTKTMKSKEDLQKFRKKKLAEYGIDVDI